MEPREHRKRGHEGGRDLDEGESDGENRLPTPPQGSGDEDNDKTIEFACPFLKHNPREHGQI